MFRWLKDRSRKGRKLSTDAVSVCSEQSKEDDYGFKQKQVVEYKRDLPPTPVDLMTSCNVIHDDERSLHIYEEIPDLPFRCTPEGELRITLAREEAAGRKGGGAPPSRSSSSPSLHLHPHPLFLPGARSNNPAVRNISPYMVVPLERLGGVSPAEFHARPFVPEFRGRDLSGNSLTCPEENAVRLHGRCGDAGVSGGVGGAGGGGPTTETPSCDSVVSQGTSGSSCCGSSVFGSPLDVLGRCGSAGGDGGGGDMSDRLLSAINLTRLLAAVRLSSSSADTCTTSPICIGVDKDGRNISVSVSVTPTTPVSAAAANNGNGKSNNGNGNGSLQRHPQRRHIDIDVDDAGRVSDRPDVTDHNHHHRDDVTSGDDVTGRGDVTASGDVGAGVDAATDSLKSKDGDGEGDCEEDNEEPRAFQPQKEKTGQVASGTDRPSSSSSSTPQTGFLATTTTTTTRVGGVVEVARDRRQGGGGGADLAGKLTPQAGLRFLPSPLEQDALSEVLHLRPGESTELRPEAIDALLLRLCAHTLHGEGKGQGQGQGQADGDRGHNSALQGSELEEVEKMLREMIRSGDGGAEEEAGDGGNPQQRPRHRTQHRRHQKHHHNHHHHQPPTASSSTSPKARRAENSDTGYEYDVSTSSESEPANYDYFLSKVARTRSLECEVKKLIRSSDSPSSHTADDEDDDRDDDDDDDDDDDRVSDTAESLTTVSTLSPISSLRPGGHHGDGEADSDDGTMADLSESENSSGYYEPVTNTHPPPVAPSSTSAAAGGGGKFPSSPWSLSSASNPALASRAAATCGSVVAPPRAEAGEGRLHRARKKASPYYSASSECDPSDLEVQCFELGLLRHHDAGGVVLKGVRPRSAAGDYSSSNTLLTSPIYSPLSEASGTAEARDRFFASSSSLLLNSRSARGKCSVPGCRKSRHHHHQHQHHHQRPHHRSGSAGREGREVMREGREARGGSLAADVHRTHDLNSDKDAALTSNPASTLTTTLTPSPAASRGAVVNSNCDYGAVSLCSGGRRSSGGGGGKDSDVRTGVVNKSGSSSGGGGRVKDSTGHAKAATTTRGKKGLSRKAGGGGDYAYSYVYPAPANPPAGKEKGRSGRKGAGAGHASGSYGHAKPLAKGGGSRKGVDRAGSFHAEATENGGDPLYDSSRQGSEVYSFPPVLPEGDGARGGLKGSVSVPSKLSVARQVPESSEVYGTRAGLQGCNNNRLLSDLIMLNYNRQVLNM